MNVVEMNTTKSKSKNDEAAEILAFLNKKTGRNYRPVQVNLDFILARLREGYTAQDCRAVVAMKCREWGADEKMNKFLRPATLFNREKFNQYSGELGEIDGDVS